MFASELISETILPLKTTDNGEIALTWMEEFKVSQLPVIDNNRFIGLISETDVLNRNNLAESLNNYISTAGKVIYVTQNQHIFEVIKIFDVHKLTVLPVLDEKNHYMGSIDLFSLVQHFAHMTAVQEPGGIIILEVNATDYLLTQIAQIVESSDAKILGLYISSFPESTRMEVTLKLNITDLRSVLQTFNRYNYVIKASFAEMDPYEDLRERYDSLMRYLNT